MFFDWNWKVAEKEFQHAIKLNPNSAIIHLYYSWYLTFTLCHNEAVAEIKQAQLLDPLSAFINTNSGLADVYASHCDRAIEDLRTVIAMNPSYFLTLTSRDCLSWKIIDE